MKIFNILIIIISIKSLDSITKNAHLEENLPVLLQKLKENLEKNSAVLPFEKLKEQLTDIKNSLQKYLVKVTEKDFGPRTIVKELVDKLSCSTALIEEHDFEDTIDQSELQKISEEIKTELKDLLDIFKKKIDEKNFEHQDNKDLQEEFIKQDEEIIAYLEKFSSEDFDLPKEKDFEEKVKKGLISLGKILISLNREDYVASEVAVFSKELAQKLDGLIEILKENCNEEQQNNSNITDYCYKVREELISLCNFLLKIPSDNLKVQSELIKIQPDFFEKFVMFVNFLTDPSLYKSEALTIKEVNPTALGENLEVDSIASTQILPENTWKPLVLTDPVPAKDLRFEDKISLINPPNNTVLTESNGSPDEFGPDNQHNNERNIQDFLSTIEIEESNEGPYLQNSPITNHNDTNPTSLNPLQKRPITSLVLEPEDQLGLNTSPKELSIDNLSTAMQGPKDELEPEKNVQNNNMTASKEYLQEESPEVLSINTKDETMLESQQSENSNNTIQGDDPKISEALNLSNDEQFILQHENSNKPPQGDDPKISEALNFSNDEQFILQNENSILRNTNKDQNKENPSQISKDNVKKELGKTNEDSLHNNGHAIVKDELKNNKAPEVEKKIEKIVKDVDFPEKNKAEPKITEDFKTDLSKKNYDNLKKFANNHSKKKNLLKGVQQKSFSNSDSKTLHFKKYKQLEDSSPKKVLNRHKKFIVEDGPDKPTILRVSSNVSADKKNQVDDGKPQNSVKRNDFMSFKAKPHLNVIIPIITLNFTISRRIL